MNPDVREMSPEPNFEIDIDIRVGHTKKTQTLVFNLKAIFSGVKIISGAGLIAHYVEFQEDFNPCRWSEASCGSQLCSS